MNNKIRPRRSALEEGSGSSIWHRLGRFFHGNQFDSVEQAIREASIEGELEKEEGSMLLSVLTLDDMQVQDIMTPRTDIVAIPDTSTATQVADVIIESGHSRLPVYKDDRDNIIGIIHAKDLMPYTMSQDPETVNTQVATKIMRSPFFVPETKNVLGLLHEFRARKQHMAIILDEYGGTAGIVSIEDVIEEIVGEIEDEHDAPREEDILIHDDGSYTVSGRTPLEDLEEKLFLRVESEEVDTIGGYISMITGRVPKSGDKIEIEDAIFTVQEADAKQIHSLRLELANDKQTENNS